MTLIVLCTMVFAGCGRKKVTVDTSILAITKMQENV